MKLKKRKNPFKLTQAIRTFTIPSVSPVASISPSLENVNDSTAASCIINSSRA